MSIPPPQPGMAPVTDCPEFAWLISNQQPLRRLALQELPRFARPVHAAAVHLIAPLLVLEWARRGYLVTFAPAAQFAPPPESDALHIRVANAAADAIDHLQLLVVAGLATYEEPA